MALLMGTQGNVVVIWDMIYTHYDYYPVLLYNIIHIVGLQPLVIGFLLGNSGIFPTKKLAVF